MGDTTLTNERNRYNLQSKDRVPPSVAFPYIKTILQGMKKLNILGRIILLIDEFKDIQQLNKKEQIPVIQTFKNMLNCFNWELLFVMIAGQEGVFTSIGSQYTSLANKWRRVSLKPIEKSEQAIQLAQAYMQHQHNSDYLKQGQEIKAIGDLRPTQRETKDIFTDLKETKKSTTVTQRDWLDELSSWVEKNSR